MQLFPLKTRLVESSDDLKTVILDSLKAHELKLESGDILVIASKIVAYSQGLLEPFSSEDDFKALIRREADEMLDEGVMTLTMKYNILIPNAGIDRSNTPDSKAVLWPLDPFGTARKIRQEFLNEFDLKEMGVLISDSHCQPMRMGTSGIAIGWSGFEGVQDKRGAKDLFGRKMVYTKIAVADDLTCAANVLMGETDERIPLVLIRGFEANFTEEVFSAEDYFMPPKDCLYKPLYSDKLLK